MKKSDRMAFIDNIRWTMIVFVVTIHAAVTYSNLGMWYYIEPVKLDLISLAFFGIYQSFTQAYSMGLLFFIAGYFVPGSYNRKGFIKFLKDRAVRLGIPTLIYMLFINTTINYYFLAFKWTTNGPSAGQFLWNYIQSFGFLSGSGPMWFALALLIFSILYAIFRLLFHDERFQVTEGNIPGHLSVAGLILLISIFAFLLRLAQPIGSNILNMQLGFFSQYIILFIVGTIAGRKNWMAQIPYSFGMVWFKASLIGGSILWLCILILGGGLSDDLVKYRGGLCWQSAAYALWESFFCVGVCIGLIVLFRERFNRQDKFKKFMSENYFSVYVFHAPILILTTLALREFAWHPIIKFIAAVAISLPLCFLSSHLIFRRIPLLKRVL